MSQDRVRAPVRVSLALSGIKLKALVGFSLFSLIISLGFFWEGTKSGYSSLSGDQDNILTIVAKKDHPHLLQGDMLVGNPRAVDYYIPVFVNLVRVLSLPDHNYLRGLNILLLITSLLYMWGWWLLFSVWGDRWLAAVLAFLVRGLMWPPGNEMWGIAGLWTMLPRTLFLALLPWVLWSWFRYRSSRRGWVLIAFACGLLANIHPISGLCVSVALMFAESVWTLAESKSLKTTVSRIFIGGVAILVGMAPFIWTYLTMLGSTQGVDPAEFYRAAQMRLNPIFWNAGLYLREWLQPKLLFLIFMPWIACWFVLRRQLAAYKNTLLALAAFSVGCLLTALLPFLFEAILHRLGYQARFAFQLVRTGKYIMVPSIILAAMVLIVAGRQLARRYEYGRALIIGASCVVLLLTCFSRSPVFDGVPVLGDDISRFLWPSLSGPGQVSQGSGDKVEQNLEGTLRWIMQNTPEDAKFIGPRKIRAGALRPVIFDFAGAGVLIEGDPKALVEAAKRKLQQDETRKQGASALAKLYASWGADYWVTQADSNDLHLVYSDSGWRVYDLMDAR